VSLLLRLELVGGKRCGSRLAWWLCVLLGLPVRVRQLLLRVRQLLLRVRQLLLRLLLLL